jgi:hypothetical protein
LIQLVFNGQLLNYPSLLLDMVDMLDMPLLLVVLVLARRWLVVGWLAWCEVMRSRLRHLARRFWNQTCEFGEWMLEREKEREDVLDAALLFGGYGKCFCTQLNR